MTKKRWIATVVAICMVVLLFQYIPVLHASAATEGSIKSGVTGVYFRETPGGTPIKDSNGNTIYLNGGQALTIQDTSNSSWYKVTLTYNGGSYTGYVSSQYVVAGAAPTPSTPSGDADFEAKLSAQGFPDSYKPYLRAIHEKYPNWEFRAVQTGVDWNTLVANEVSKSGQVTGDRRQSVITLQRTHGVPSMERHGLRHRMNWLLIIWTHVHTCMKIIFLHLRACLISRAYRMRLVWKRF